VEFADRRGSFMVRMITDPSSKVYKAVSRIVDEVYKYVEGFEPVAITAITATNYCGYNSFGLLILTSCGYIMKIVYYNNEERRKETLCIDNECKDIKEYPLTIELAIKEIHSILADY